MKNFNVKFHFRLNTVNAALESSVPLIDWGVTNSQECIPAHWPYLVVSAGGRYACHTCRPTATHAPPAMHAPLPRIPLLPCTCPLPCMPLMHAPCNACPPPPVDRILDTCFWKYYLAPTSLRAVIKPILCDVLFSFIITMTQRERALRS